MTVTRFIQALPKTIEMLAVDWLGYRQMSKETNSSWSVSRLHL